MPFPFDADPAIIWSLALDGRIASCEVAFVPIGVAARVLRDGTLLYSRIFPKGDDAFAWAEEERKDHMQKAWL